MKLKKSTKVNLESKRGLFRDLGLVLGVLLAYGMMTWQFSEGAKLKFTATGEGIDLDTVVQIAPPKPPEPPKPPVDPTQFDKVLDTKIYIPDITFADMGEVNTEFTLLEKVGETETETFTFVNVEALPYLDGCSSVPTNEDRWYCTESEIKQIINSEFVIPQICVDLGISGRAWVSFIIEADGSISNVSIAQSSGDELIDQEALRVVRKLPNFTPAKLNGRSVRMSYNVPINVQVN